MNELSEYELLRLENIKKNDEFLKSIGLYKDINNINKTSNNLDDSTIRNRNKQKKKKKAIDDDRKSINDSDNVIDSINNSNTLRRSTRGKDNIISSKNDIHHIDDIITKRKRNDSNIAKESLSLDNDDDDNDDDTSRINKIKITCNELKDYIYKYNKEHLDLVSDKVHY